MNLSYEKVETVQWREFYLANKCLSLKSSKPSLLPCVTIWSFWAHLLISWWMCFLDIDNTRLRFKLFKFKLCAHHNRSLIIGVNWSLRLGLKRINGTMARVVALLFTPHSWPPVMPLEPSVDLCRRAGVLRRWHNVPGCSVAGRKTRLGNTKAEGNRSLQVGSLSLVQLLNSQN